MCGLQVVTMHSIDSIESLYDSFNALSSKVLNREDVAIILPLIFFDLGVVLPQCRELSSCIKLFELFSLLINRGHYYFPHDKYELDGCLRSRVCMYHKSNLFTHV